MSETTNDTPEPGTTATTTKTKDHLGRLLVTPGTVGKDFLGRAIQAGDKDYKGEALA